MLNGIMGLGGLGEGIEVGWLGGWMGVGRARASAKWGRLRVSGGSRGASLPFVDVCARGVVVMDGLEVCDRGVAFLPRAWRATDNVVSFSFWTLLWARTRSLCLFRSSRVSVSGFDVCYDVYGLWSLVSGLVVYVFWIRTLVLVCSVIVAL